MCSLQVNIAIAYIDGIFFFYIQLAEGFHHGVGGRLLADALGFMLANGHFYGVGEEMVAELTGGSIELIAYHGNAAPPAVQFAE